MTSLLTPDVCIIGGGRAGVTMAMGLAAMQVPTVLVERGVVGACAHDHVGLEAFFDFARRSHAVRTATHVGIAGGSGRVDWLALQTEVARRAERLRANMAQPRLTALGVDVIHGEGGFEDRKTLVAGHHTIRPRRFVLATGAEAVAPPIAGLADTPHVLLQDALKMIDLPKAMLIIGHDTAAAELAQAFARMGVRVELAGAGIFGALPFEAADAIRQGLSRDGVVIHHETPTAVRKDRSSIKADLPDGVTVAVTRLMVQGKVRAKTEALRLDRAAVDLIDGRIVTNGRLRTGNSRIFALGGAAGLSGSEDHDAGVILKNIIFRQWAQRQPERVAVRVATDPGYAAIGQLASSKKTGRIQVLRAPFGNNERAVAEDAGPGHINITTDAGARVLGVSIVGRGAGELLAHWAGLVQRRAKLNEVLELSQSYPSLADLGRNAALPLQVRNLTKPWVQRIIRLVRSLG